MKMHKAVPGLLTVALCIGASATTMYAADAYQGSVPSVFVMTNDNAKNEILTYRRSFDGQFILADRVATGGRGSGGETDPLQSQGSLTISGDHSLLFAVNSASGSVSSFNIRNGIPVFIDKQSSGGAFPVAVAEHNDVVYVLNAGGNGAVVAFKADRLGRLREIQNSSTFLTGLNSGASDISVSPNGQWLVVIEKASNSIDVFPINPDGTLGTVVKNHSVTPGVFATAFTSTGQLIISENQP
jgi:6-phosphogluconolactonase (cycloisomerase 2 family)